MKVESSEIEKSTSDSHRVVIYLDEAPSDTWIREFRNLTNYHFVMGVHPVDVKFQANMAIVDALDPERALICIREWIDEVTTKMEVT